MANYNLNDVYDASALIKKGLSKKLSPNSDIEYKRLIDKVYSVDDFYKLVCKVAEGLSLDVVEIGEFGIVLSALELNSSFSMKLDEYRKELGVEDDSKQDSSSKRALLSLVLIAIPATFYPTAETLEEDDGSVAKKATIQEVVTVIRGLSEELIVNNNLEFTQYLKDGASYVNSLPDSIPSQKQDTFSSMYGAIAIIMNHLTEEGLLHYEDDMDGGFYSVRQKYRALLQNRLANSLLESLMLLRENENVTD